MTMRPVTACCWLAAALVAGGQAEVRCENIQDVTSDFRGASNCLTLPGVRITSLSG